MDEGHTALHELLAEHGARKYPLQSPESFTDLRVPPAPPTADLARRAGMAAAAAATRTTSGLSVERAGSCGKRPFSSTGSFPQADLQWKKDAEHVRGDDRLEIRFFPSFSLAALKEEARNRIFRQPYSTSGDFGHEKPTCSIKS